MKVFSSVAIFSALFSIFSGSVYAQDAVSASAGKISGTAGIVSKYIYRGGVENDDLAAQAGLEYAHQSGWNIGYWGSTLSYNPSNESKTRGFEHDLYIGFGQSINENWSYNSKVVTYLYQDSHTIYDDQTDDKRSTTAVELINDVMYKNLTMSASVMLADASFANAGDVYLSAAYSYALPQDFALNASVGGSIYNTSHDDSIVMTSKETTLNETRLGISKSFADTGLVASLDYIWGGKDRLGENLDDHAVFGVNYTF